MARTYAAGVQGESTTPQRTIRIGLADASATVGERRVGLPARELLLCATLGLHRRPMSTEEIVDCIWPDRDLEPARLCLRVHVHRMRARLGRFDAVLSAGQRWSLGPGVSLDIWEWRALARGTGSGTDVGALRTPLLEAFDQIVSGPAPSLTRSYLGRQVDAIFADLLLHIGGRLIDDALARLDTVEATRLARSAIAVDPYGERWHEALIRAQMLDGNVSAAHASLRSYKATLASELRAPLPKAIVQLLRTAERFVEGTVS